MEYGDEHINEFLQVFVGGQVENEPLIEQFERTSLRGEIISISYEKKYEALRFEVKWLAFRIGDKAWRDIGILQEYTELEIIESYGIRVPLDEISESLEAIEGSGGFCVDYTSDESGTGIVLSLKFYVLGHKSNLRQAEISAKYEGPDLGLMRYNEITLGGKQ